MPRVLRPLCLPVLVALASACSRPAAPARPDPLTLLPGDASLVAHVDLAALRAAPLWQQNRALLDADPDARKTLDALAACRVPFDGLRSLDLAVAANGVDVAAVVIGDGVGDRERITCLEGQLPDRGLRLDVSGPEPVVVLGSARGRIVGPDVLVLGTAGWAQQLDALRAGTGTSAAAGPLQPLLARVAADRPIWFAGQVPTRAAVSLAPALSGLEQVRGALDLRDGLGVELALGMHSEDVAGATLAGLKKQFEALRGAGLPPAILDRVGLGQTGREVTVEVRLGMAEIAALHTLAEALRPAPAPSPTPASSTSPAPTPSSASSPSPAPTPAPAASPSSAPTPSPAPTPAPAMPPAPAASPSPAPSSAPALTREPPVTPAPAPAP
ncbi:hypothetical protein [Nannocystis bainbridge]|uniref:Uncharacterized protein n=1 Tax=Nannocystis bainbridge TaxID=2995303 RepID=A0ABT5DS46_9BACT|nr:hypothetical protein [Nannocystis bainbridge]MDC0715548.1 hypothetical protein [Nannocystis bainbridge]